MVDTLEAQGTYGQHVIHEDFYGGHRLATSGVGTESVATYSTGETDGVLRLSTDTSDGSTAVIGSGAVFAPATNGPLAFEARVKINSLTSSAAWVGFSNQSGGTDEVSDGGTLQSGVTDAAGLYFDAAVDSDQWNEYLATGSAETQQNLVAEVITADRWQVIRVEIDPDGSVSTYIADVYGKSGYGVGSLRLIATRKAAILSTALLFAEVYAATSTSSAKRVDIDYYHLTAGRDWQVA